MSNLYDIDFHSWAQLQAQLIREGRVDEADLDLIAEEIEDLGNNRRTELRNRLAVLLLHLLKWEYQPERRTRSWLLTIREQRGIIALHLSRHPSLRPTLPTAIDDGYQLALLRIERETGIPNTEVPANCPYSADDILRGDFLPGPQ